MNNFKKIGILGGTFDPVHIAHLAIAELAVEQLELDNLIFVPAWLAPHKIQSVNSTTRAAHRLQMLNLAIKDNKKFKVSDIEIKRKGASYTIDTLKEFKNMYPCELYLIIGSDNYLTFEQWRKPNDILNISKLVVYERPGFPLNNKSIPFILLKGPVLDIASTWVRKQLQGNKSVRYFLPENVRKYIYDNKLYKNPNYGD